MYRAILRGMLIGLLLLLLWTPAFALFASAFHDSYLPLLSLSNFSSAAFQAAFESREIWESAILSLSIAVPVGVSCSAIGWFLASRFYRWRGVMPNFLASLIFVPLLLPPNTVSLAFNQGLRFFGGQPGIGAVILAHIILYLPIGYVFHLTRMKQLPKDILVAAQNLGGGFFTIFRFVYWRHESNVFWAAILVVSALSWDEPTVAYYLSDISKPLAVRITQMMQSAFDPGLQAASVIVFLITTLLISVGGLMQWRTLNRGGHD